MGPGRYCSEVGLEARSQYLVARLQRVSEAHHAVTGKLGHGFLNGKWGCC